MVNDNIIQPGMEKAMDPNLRATASGYLNEASKRATDMASGANDWGRQRFGVDVAEKARQTFVGPGSKGEYSALAASHSGAEWESSYHDDDDDDFFAKHGGHDAAPGSASSQGAGTSGPVKPIVQKKATDDDDDDWKDF